MATKTKTFKTWLNRGFITVTRDIEVELDETWVDATVTICDGNNVVRLNVYEKEIPKLAEVLRKAANTMEGK